jgi:hypothetical protein
MLICRQRASPSWPRKAEFSSDSPKVHVYPELRTADRSIATRALQSYGNKAEEDTSVT